MNYNPLGESEKTAVDGFKTKSREFWGVWEDLDSKSIIADSAPPELKNEYDDLMERGVTIRKNIERITRVIDSASNAYGKAVDYTSRGIETAVNWFKGTTGLGALNAIPLIPIAVIGVALSAMSKWLKDAYVVNKKLDMMESLMAKGMSPEKALMSANKLVNKPSLFNISAGVGLPLMIAAVVSFLYFKRGKQ